MSRYTKAERLAMELETINKELEACEKVMRALQQLYNESKDDIYVAMTLYRLMRVLKSMMDSFHVSRMTKETALRELAGQEGQG